jgi:hypothetical protein
MQNISNVRQGSALLMLLFAVATIFLLCCKDRFATNLLVDIALKKEIHEKKWWAAHGLLQYGCVYCSKNFFELYSYVSSPMPMSLTMTSLAWPCGPGESDRCNAQITFSKHAQDAVLIQVQLGDEQRGVLQGSCIVSCGISGEKMVSAWHLI